jgi:hypothetical protein
MNRREARKNKIEYLRERERERVVRGEGDAGSRGFKSREGKKGNINAE